MSDEKPTERFPPVGDGSDLASDESFFKEELQLAARNRGMPLEALRYPITPTGMHYLLVHFDIPEVDAGRWRLEVGGLVAKPLGLTLEELERRPGQDAANAFGHRLGGRRGAEAPLELLGRYHDPHGSPPA